MWSPGITFVQCMVNNTEMRNRKKRKFNNNEYGVKLMNLSNENESSYLDCKCDNKLKTVSANSGSHVKVKLHSDSKKKHFKTCNKRKVVSYHNVNESKVGTVIHGVRDQKVTPVVSGDKAQNHVGNKVNHKEVENKTCNVSHEKKILLTKIDRKGVCSNWKLFKEIVGKDDSLAGKASEKRKMPNNPHKSEMRKMSNKSMKLDNVITGSQKTDVALEKKKQSLNYNYINGETSCQNKPFNNTHKFKDWRKTHSDNLQTEKPGKKADVRSVMQQDTPLSAPHKNSNRLTKEIALDCEMVGTDDSSDMVARVSLVNKFGSCVYDKYVAPTEKVSDYRTWVSGIRPEDLKNAEDFKQVQKEVAELLQGRLLVGHAVRNDLKVLFLSHPRKYTRDTQRFKLFRELAKTKRPSLKKLASAVLNISIQEGEHSSVEDARVAMQLYMMYRNKWEKLFRKSRRKQSSENVPVSAE